MPKYQAQAIDNAGQAKFEQVDAGSEQEAIQILEKRQLAVIELKLVATKPDATSAPKSPKRVPVNIVIAFYEQLGFLTKAGIPVFLAIKMLGDSMKHPALEIVLKQVLFDLSEGSPLSTSLQKFPDSFPFLHTNLIAVGEKSGNLDGALGQLVELVREEQDIRARVVKAAAYPIFLLSLSLSLVIGLLLHIFPKFEEIFNAFQVKLPATTQFFLDASHALRNHQMVIFSTLLVAVSSIVYFFRSETTSLQRDKFFLAVPIMHDVFVSMFVALFSKTMSSLLKSGVPLLDALTICQATIRGKLKEAFFHKLISVVREGEPTSKAMEGEPLVPEMARQLIIVGEKTGRIDVMLENVFYFYKKRYGEMLAKLTAVLQPLLMLFAAGLIALVAISLFVPLFKLSGSMKGGE